MKYTEPAPSMIIPELWNKMMLKRYQDRIKEGLKKRLEQLEKENDMATLMTQEDVLNQSVAVVMPEEEVGIKEEDWDDSGVEGMEFIGDGFIGNSIYRCKSCKEPKVRGAFKSRVEVENWLKNHKCPDEAPTEHPWKNYREACYKKFQYKWITLHNEYMTRCTECGWEGKFLMSDDINSVMDYHVCSIAAALANGGTNEATTDEVEKDYWDDTWDDIERGFSQNLDEDYMFGCTRCGEIKQFTKDEYEEDYDDEDKGVVDHWMDSHVCPTASMTATDKDWGNWNTVPVFDSEVPDKFERRTNLKIGEYYEHRCKSCNEVQASVGSLAVGDAWMDDHTCMTTAPNEGSVGLTLEKLKATKNALMDTEALAISPYVRALQNFGLNNVDELMVKGETTIKDGLVANPVRDQGANPFDAKKDREAEHCGDCKHLKLSKSIEDKGKPRGTPVMAMFGDVAVSREE